MTASFVMSTSTLGEQVTETPEMAFTEHSMVVKRYGGVATKLPTGMQVEVLWKKLYCLKDYVFIHNPAQYLRVFSFKPGVGGIHSCGTLFSESMMCSEEEAGSSSPLKSVVDTNGIPKGPMFLSTFAYSYSDCYRRLRRNSRTQGSSFVYRAYSIEGDSVPQDDGGSIVPNQRPLMGADLGRDPGKTDKDQGDEALMDFFPEDLFYNPTEESVSTVVDSWKQKEKLSKGITIPPRLIKLTQTMQKHPKARVDNIYHILYDPNIYDLAYSQIKSNPGNMTPGSDGSTLQGWNQETIQYIVPQMKNESFKFTPARVVEIPKPDGTMRQLMVAPPKDKIVQRIIAWILEAIFEPSFTKESFGFRPNLGCHDALKYVELQYNGARWFIEGDISKCFDEINHTLLLEILRSRIKDEKFIRLIAKALKAGYLDKWSVPKDSIVGTPQGSIVSPILCNIFMDQFDKFVSETLVPNYNKGKIRSQPPEYKRLVARAYYFDKKYRRTKDPLDLAKAKELRKLFQEMPSVDTSDPDFRRLVYCRYADDWLIGFAGPYKEAEEIRDLAKQFLATIKLRLNMDKTVITKASEGCIFLGMRIHVPQKQVRFRQKGSPLRQRAVLGVRLNAPISRIYKKLSQAGFCSPDGSKSLPRFALYPLEKDDMVKAYNSVLRGIFNYYSCCDNYKRMSNSIWYTLRSSLCKLLAAKYKLKTVRATLLKFGNRLNKSGDVFLLDWKDQSLRLPLFKLGGKSESRLLGLFRKASHTIRAGALE